VTGRTVQYYFSNDAPLYPTDTFLVRAAVWY
jgi:hypothetical protein